MAHIEHITVDGERWDQIAWRYYRNVNLQTEIISANRHLFLTKPVTPIPAILTGGIALKVPVLEERRDETTLPPWKRGAPLPPVTSL